MNKTCARCEKTVYPTEELKCLDKVWHKGCFKCQECGMTLNMRTYKGYGKLPYCEAHVPKAKHTTMAETPELKRIAENTKIQSNVKYHADFEKSKGKFTQVADDPETLRIKANTKIISNVAYHGDLAKKAAMEKQRQINENGELVEPSITNKTFLNRAPPNRTTPTPPSADVATNDNYHQQIDSYATEMLPAPVPNLPPKNHYQTPAQQNPRPYQPEYKYDPYQYAKYDEYAYQNNYGGNNSQPKIGRIQDYDPLSDGPRAPPNVQHASATLIYNSTRDGKQRGTYTGSNQAQQQQSRQIGRVTDMDPLAAEQPRPANNHHSPQNSNQRVYIAMYDYEANDSDEVSFREGDYISNVTSIDEGWMTGEVLRTGRTGMLPANYVELAPAPPHHYAN